MERTQIFDLMGDTGPYPVNSFGCRLMTTRAGNINALIVEQVFRHRSPFRLVAPVIDHDGNF
jgi:hypothetical protein